jgi:hypothetical protein
MEYTHVIRNTFGLRFQIAPIKELDNNISTLFSPHVLTKVHTQYFWQLSVMSAVCNKTENCIVHADSLTTGTRFSRLVTEYCIKFEYHNKSSTFLFCLVLIGFRFKTKYLHCRFYLFSFLILQANA